MVSTSPLQPNRLRAPVIVIAALLPAVCLIWLFMPFLFGQINHFGVYIPPHDIVADYVTGVCWALALTIVVAFAPVPKEDRRALLFLWAAKVVVALGLMLYYEYTYPVIDSYSYYARSDPAYFVWTPLQFGDGTNNMYRLSSLQGYLTPHSFHAMKVTCSAIGLAGIYMSYRAWSLYLGKPNVRVLYVLGLFPGILFWSSIFGKDPIALLGISMYMYGTVGYLKRGGARYVVIGLIGTLISMLMRTWLGIILLTPLFVVVLYALPRPRDRVLMLLLAAVAMPLAWSQFSQAFAISTSQELLSQANYWSRGWAIGGSAQQINTQFTSAGSILKFMPLGMFTALFRPVPGEVMNPFGILAGLEDSVLLVMLGLSIVRTPLRELLDPILAWAILVVVVWAALYSVISYQNLGTAVQFKSQIEPLVVLILVHLSRRRSPSSVVRPAAA